MHENQHILILSSWYPNRKSPFLGNFVMNHARLVAQSFHVTLLHTVADESCTEIEIVETQHDQLREIVIYHPKGSHFFERRKAIDRAFDAGLHMISGVDLIHAHVLLPKGYLFVKAKKLFNCPLIVTEHSSIFARQRQKSWSLKDHYIARTTRKHINYLVAVSEFQQKDLSRYFKETPTTVIPNPVDVQLFAPATTSYNEKFRFLHISTLDPTVKNPYGIVDAVALLHEKGYRTFELVIVSDESVDALKTYIESKGLSKHIRFFGPCQPEELPPFYRASDAFILNSDYESFSIVVAEAWACGIPVISTSVGIAANLPSHLGIQVEARNPLSLAIGMERIFNGTTFDRKVIRDHALLFSNEAVLDAVKKLYAHVLK
jgi:glycosyltransferase involved in cell wall biosynthesis